MRMSRVISRRCGVLILAPPLQHPGAEEPTMKTTRLVILTLSFASALGHANGTMRFRDSGVRGNGGTSQYPAAKLPPGYSFVRIHHGELQTQPMWGIRAPSGGIYNGLARAEQAEKDRRK
jgi:hypothetical protein